jgi:hypothetical protein
MVPAVSIFRVDQGLLLYTPNGVFKMPAQEEAKFIRQNTKIDEGIAKVFSKAFLYHSTFSNLFILLHYIGTSFACTVYNYRRLSSSIHVFPARSSRRYTDHNSGMSLYMFGLVLGALAAIHTYVHTMSNNTAAETRI